MARAEIRSTLLDRLAASRKCSRQELEIELASSDAIDSEEGVELLLKAEEVYGISLPDDAFRSPVCSAIDKLVEVIESHTSSED